MTESEAYTYAIEIFEQEEGRSVNWKSDGVSDFSKDEIAIACIHTGIVHTLKKFNLLK